MRLSRLSEGMPMTQSSDHRTRGEALPLVDEVDELLALVDVELAVDVADVGAHRRDGEDEGLRDVGRREAAGQKHEHLGPPPPRRSGPPECFACSTRPARRHRRAHRRGRRAQSHRERLRPRALLREPRRRYPRQRRRRHPILRPEPTPPRQPTREAPPARSTTCGRETPGAPPQMRQ